MMKYFFILFLVFLIGCNLENQSKEDEYISTGNVRELEIYKKPQDLFLYLKYDSTALIENDVTLFFTFSVRNATNDTIRLLAENQPSYHPFIIDGSRGLEFYESQMRVLYSNFPIYKYFNPKETTSYALKLKLADGIQKLNAQKVRIGFKGYFGSLNQSPSDLIELYHRINVSKDFPMYWSNFVELKNDFIHIK